MVVDLFLVYQFIRRLATPFNKWKAYDLGIIDEKGKVLIKRKDFTKKAQSQAWGIFDIMIANLKKLLAKVPGGSSRLASYAAALFLIKEYKHFTDESMLTEDLTEEDLEKSLLEFHNRYNHYTMLAEDVNGFLSEKLKKSDDMGTWIKDFYDSDAPQFKGKSKAKRRQMAVAAKLSAEEQNEELGHFVKKTRQAVHSAVKAAVVGKSGDTANRHVSKAAQSAHRISGAAKAQGSDSNTSHIQSKRINQQMATPQRRYESVNEEGGAGGEGTDKLTKKYKKDTPGQNNG